MRVVSSRTAALCTLPLVIVLGLLLLWGRGGEESGRATAPSEPSPATSAERRAYGPTASQVPDSPDPLGQVRESERTVYERGETLDGEPTIAAIPGDRPYARWNTGPLAADRERQLARIRRIRRVLTEERARKEANGETAKGETYPGALSPQVEEKLESGYPADRIEAIDGIDGDDLEGLEVLLDVLENDTSWAVRSAAVEQLAMTTTHGGMSGLIYALSDDDPRVVAQAIQEITYSADPTVALNLVPLLGHSDDAVRQAAAEAIESLEE